MLGCDSAGKFCF